MNLKRVLLGVTVGWTVLSIAGGVGYLLATRSSAVVVEQGWRPLPSRITALKADAERGKPRDPELEALAYRYFPKPLSQGLEEVLIRAYFQDRPGGFLLDVGASHYQTRSTTHYLDVALGWRGIAVDAIAEYAADYAKFRPRTKFFPAFVSDRSDQTVDFFVKLDNPRESTADAALAKSFERRREVRELPTVTLDAILEAEKVDEIDLLSIDIELWEPKALAGFSIDRYKPELVVIEWHPPVQEELARYFAEHRYVRIDKYSDWDGRNAYFVPAEDLPKFLAREGGAASPVRAEL